MKETKKALIVSGLSLILCFVLMSGMTFAWFTDSVFNKGNHITAGTLVVDLLMDEKKDGTYVSIDDSKGDSKKHIFSDTEGGNGYGWEAGKTEIVFLAVRNNGQLDLTYNIDLDITGDLAGSLEYALISDKKASDINGKNWEEIKSLAGQTSGDAKVDISFSEEKMIAAGETQPMSYFALAIHMKEDALAEMQGKSADIDLLVHATQVTEKNGDVVQP